MLQHEAAAYEFREMNSKPDMFLPEVTHSVAYNEKGFGSLILCSEDRLNKMDKGLRRRALQEWYRPEKMAIPGGGMPHDELMEHTRHIVFRRVRQRSVILE